MNRLILPFLVVALASSGALAADADAAPAPAAAEEAMPSAADIDAALAGESAKPSEPTRPPPMEIDEEKMKELPPPSIGVGELIGPLAKTMLMLCVVLAIVYLTLHKGLGKLMERQNLGKRMKVVERVALDTKRTLFLVEIDGKQMVLAAGEGGVVVIKDMEAGARPAPTFAEVLKSAPPAAPPPTTTASTTHDTPVTGA